MSKQCCGARRRGLEQRGGMKSNAQKAIDDLIESKARRSTPPGDMAALLSWAEVDGWDECVKAWEVAGEPVVVDWKVFCEEYANDRSVEEYEDIDQEILTDELRLAHLQSRLDDSYANPDDGHSWSVHPVQVTHTDGTAAVMCMLVQNQGQGGPVLEWFGLFSSVEDALSELDSQGYRRCDLPISPHDLNTAWHR
jgi:hypothetical protein